MKLIEFMKDNPFDRFFNRIMDKLDEKILKPYAPKVNITFYVGEIYFEGERKQTSVIPDLYIDSKTRKVLSIGDNIEGLYDKPYLCFRLSEADKWDTSDFSKAQILSIYMDHGLMRVLRRISIRQIVYVKNAKVLKEVLGLDYQAIIEEALILSGSWECHFIDY